jgi:hypothetical protein
MKNKLFFVSVAVFVLGCNNPVDKSAVKTSPETTTVTDKSNDPSEMTIPDFSNHELTDFCNSYKSHIAQLITVLRNNNNAALKQPYENYMSSFDQLSKMITKARLTGPEELKNLNLFLRQTRPFLNQINQAPGIQKLR